MTSNLLSTRVDDIITGVLEAAPDELLVVNPAEDVVERLVETAIEFDGDLPAIRVLADEDMLKGVMDDFIVASNAADLIDAGRLTLRTVTDLPQSSLLVSEDQVVSLVQAGDHVGGLVADDAAFVDAARDAYDAEWDAASEFTLRTPPISQVRTTLRDEISAEAEDDFNGVLTSLETARGNGEGLDEVTISLLVAAKNRVLLYDISKWGEDVGIASKATFSRTKTKLEDMGLIDTEKVPIDVGRPRLRLKLADSRLVDADTDELANVAQSILA